MKIRSLYEAPTFPWHFVLETVDGRLMKFFINPARKITEEDLSPVPGYQARGNNSREVEDYVYSMYGLEK